jgi:hypothetical protein
VASDGLIAPTPTVAPPDEDAAAALAITELQPGSSAVDAAVAEFVPSSRMITRDVQPVSRRNIVTPPRVLIVNLREDELLLTQLAISNLRRGGGEHVGTDREEVGGDWEKGMAETLQPAILRDKERPGLLELADL